jgi:hypothetical protein
MAAAARAALLGAILASMPGPVLAGDEPPLPAPRFVAPRTGKERDEALKKAGGSATERAVDAGLDWLLRHARKEGGWDADGFPLRCEAGAKECDGIGRGQHGEEIPCPFDDALSALAAMAFLGRGHLPDPEGDATARHLEATLRGLEGTGDVWARALATELFAEAEVLERKGRWRKAALAGAAALLAARGEDGAWGYAAGFRKGSDVPYTALVVPALLAARDAGAVLPEDLGPRLDAFLDSLEASEGRLAYLVEGRQYGYTPTAYNAHAATAIRELLRVGLDGRRHNEHHSLVMGYKPQWNLVPRDVTLAGGKKERVFLAKAGLLEWWLGMLANHARGGELGNYYCASARSALLEHQRKDGCARGSWDPLGQYEKFVGGRVLATALGVLILEEPLRHKRPG